jgi:uncharacterized protein YjbI with pentapeptide repeats
MKFDIKSRWDSNKVLFTAEIEASEDTPFSIQLGLAVRKAVDAGANLAGANLTGADLAGANLTDAYLAGANLTGAYLADAYLAGANLTGAYLAGANLTGANLADAYLAGANLTGAYLADGVKVFDHTFYRDPIQINDKYFISLWDGFLIIGCERHLVSEWEAFDDETIDDMDTGALAWWNVWKPILLGMAKATGRENLPEQKKEAA